MSLSGLGKLVLLRERLVISLSCPKFPIMLVYLVTVLKCWRLRYTID